MSQPEIDPHDYFPGGHEHPRDPARAGAVGRGRRGVIGAWPDPAGNRAERRAHRKAERKATRKRGRDS